jgi:hypothetical protein
MPIRIYCPDCSGPVRAPGHGARVRCRNCDRVFRAGTRADRRPVLDEPDPEDSSGAQKFLIILGGIVILLVGLGIGGGLVAWFFLNNPPAREQPDEEVIDVNEPADEPPPDLGPRLDRHGLPRDADQ